MSALAVESITSPTPPGERWRLGGQESMGTSATESRKLDPESVQLVPDEPGALPRPAATAIAAATGLPAAEPGDLDHLGADPDPARPTTWWVLLGYSPPPSAPDEADLIDRYLNQWTGRRTATPSAPPRALELRVPNLKPLGSAEMAFCLREGLCDYLLLAICLVRTHLEPVGPLEVHLEQDPDSGDQWLTLDAVVTGSVDAILARDERFVRDWVARVPWPAVNQIRVSYDVAD